MPTKTIAYPGGNIGLSPLQAEDATAFLALAGDSRDFHHPWIQPPITIEDFQALLARCADPSFEAWAIWQLEPRRFVGMVHFSQIFRAGFQSAYLSYWVGATFAGQGWMTEGLRLALHVGFEQLRLHRLEANIQPGNLKSIALVQRLGFVKEGFSEKYLQVLGEWRDHERWAIHQEIWPESTLPAGARPILVR